MIYAKYRSEHEADFFRGRVLKAAGKIYANPTEADLAREGYLPLREIGEPECKEGFFCAPRYEIGEGELLVRYEQMPFAKEATA